MVMKILSPAGNFESLRVAVFAGADEVYLGVNNFNARNNIDGFTMDNLKEAVDFCHIHGVKVLLAINILFSDGEMQSVLDAVIDAYNMGVDAFIIQDLGLISLLYKNYPQIEIHASTQMGLHNLEGVKEVAKYGVKRVVLARETPLSEIKRIKDNLDIEIEYFAHGALCVSFSGNCYLSSYLFGASGNRGKCKQLCRLPYTFLDGQKQIQKGYLLSAKDFNMLNKLDELRDAGVDVLKIEGRARRPYYVYTTTKAYKDAINGKKISMEEIELAFNRTFTEGYFNGNGNIISELQNHIGVLVGRVERVNFGKNFNEVFISSNIELSPKSTFKFFNGKIENNTLTAFDLKEVKKGYYKITTTQKVSVGDSVRLIVDQKKERELSELDIKRQLSVRLDFVQGQTAKAYLNLNNTEYIIEGDICSPAIKQPISVGELRDNFSKSQEFAVDLQITSLDKIFMPKQRLNDLRRRTIEKAREILTLTERAKLDKIKISLKQNIGELKDYAIIEKDCELPKNKAIIYSPETYDIKDIEFIRDKCLNAGKEFYLDTPNFALKEDIEIIKNVIEKTKVAIVANNYYALGFNAKKIIGFGLNAYNCFTKNQLATPFIPAENCENLVAPLMTLRHCPLKSHLKIDCKNCKYHDGYLYKMDSGKVFKLKRKKLSTCTFYIV